MLLHQVTNSITVAHFCILRTRLQPDFCKAVQVLNSLLSRLQSAWDATYKPYCYYHWSAQKARGLRSQAAYAPLSDADIASATNNGKVSLCHCFFQLFQQEEQTS